MLASGGLGGFGQLLEGGWFHAVLLVPVIALAWISFPVAFRIHGRRFPGVLACKGILSLSYAAYVGEAFETSLTLIGACLLVFAHLWNRRLLTCSLTSTH